MPASETVVPPTLPSIHLEPGSEPGTGTSSQADLIRTRPEDEAPADVDMEIGRHGAETLNERVRRVEAQLESLLTVGLHRCTQAVPRQPSRGPDPHSFLFDFSSFVEYLSGSARRASDSMLVIQLLRNHSAEDPLSPAKPTWCLALPKVTELSKWGALTLRRNTEVLTQGPQNICTAKITSISQLAVTRPTRTGDTTTEQQVVILNTSTHARRLPGRADTRCTPHVRLAGRGWDAGVGVPRAAAQVVQARSGAPESVHGWDCNAEQLGAEERALNTTIGGLAKPEDVHAKREKGRGSRTGMPFLPSGRARESESGGPFAAAPELRARIPPTVQVISTRRPPASGPQPTPRHEAHYVTAQSSPRHAVRACISTRTLDDALCRCAWTTPKSTGEGGPESGIRAASAFRAPSPAQIDHATYAARYDSRGGPQPGNDGEASTAKGEGKQHCSERLVHHTDDTCERGGAVREGKGRREAHRSGWASRYMQTRAQCRDGYTAQKQERGGLDTKLRGDETHLPGPAPEVPIAWGCHITDARRGTPSASAGREGTDGALAEWAAGENESSTKKTHLKSPICNSCSRGSSIRARRRAGAGEDETEARALDQAHGVWERQNGIAWGTAVHGGFSGGGQVEETVSPNARTAPTPSTRARGAAPSPHSSSAADASAGNDEDGGGDGCADDEGENLVAALCAVILLEKVQMSHFFISVSQLRELWLKSGTTRSPAAPGPDP
ncbi:hypothetical protein FB451DRAFT_1190194 [Mycena latifolia]|nr:hypothetical protein FB451DRAFT_1190194 [Mycena latifolia]